MSNKVGNALKYKHILEDIRGIKHTDKKYRKRGEDFQEIDGVIINTTIFGNVLKSVTGKRTSYGKCFN